MNFRERIHKAADEWDDLRPIAAHYERLYRALSSLAESSEEVRQYPESAPARLALEADLNEARAALKEARSD